MNELGTDLLVAWLRERRDNAIQIAKTKEGEDRNGWVEDAFYFNEAVKNAGNHRCARAAVAGDKPPRCIG